MWGAVVRWLGVEWRGAVCLAWFFVLFVCLSAGGVIGVHAHTLYLSHTYTYTVYIYVHIYMQGEGKTDVIHSATTGC